jgi:hypothetical protein
VADEISNIKSIKITLNSARNSMAQAFEKNDSAGDKKLKLGDELDKFKNLKAVEPNEGVESIDNYLTELKDKHNVEPTEKPKEVTTEEPGGDDDNGSDNTEEALQKAEEAKAAAKVEYDKVKDGEDKKAIIQAKIKFLQAQQKIAKIKGDDEAYQGFGDEIGVEMQKIQDLDKGGEDTEEGPSTEKDVKEFLQRIKEEKLELSKERKKLEELKSEQKRSTDPEEFDKQIVNQEEAIKLRLEDIKELEGKYQKAKKEAMTEESVEPDKIIDDEDEEEANDLEDTKDEAPVQSVKALPKFMKFEDYIATKNKK